jgi:hypothetical protein
MQIKVITKLANSEQSYKGKVKTHNYINRQNQSTENCENRNDPDLVAKSGTISCLMRNIYLYFIILKLFTNFQNIKFILSNS